MDEEKKRAAMGQSAWRTVLDMLDIVKKAEPHRNEILYADLLANVLAVRPETAKARNSDTCGRYLAVAAKLTDKCTTVVSMWELTFQRNALLDGIA